MRPVEGHTGKVKYLGFRLGVWECHNILKLHIIGGTCESYRLRNLISSILYVY